MVTLQELREYMRSQVSEDRNRKSIQVTGATVEECLQEASVELDLPVKRLAYEVLEKGNPGLFGVSKKNYILIVYEAEDEESVDGDGDDVGVDFDMIGEMEEQEADLDGEVIVRLGADGVLLKVTPPVGKGKRATERAAVHRLEQRGIDEFDRDLVSKVVKEAGSEFVNVGDFHYNPANDSVMSVDIIDHEMKAVMVVQPAGPGGVDQSYQSIMAFLKNNDVIHGIKEDVIRDFEDHPAYNTEIVVAEGTAPVDGRDARIVYNFDAKREQIKLKEKNGRVDFREMNLVQNVVEGQVLAKKVPPEEGRPGRTVMGKLLAAKDGEDVEIGAGKNVEIGGDGMEARATLNGQVILSNGKINVEPIYVVEGDVNLKTGGNVTFLGTVYVKGNVDDGFKVKASGNVEVMGNVGKANVDAEGDVIVHQGVTGKSGGQIRSGKSIWAKFIENASVDAAEFVVASDGIINSQVVANKKIVVQGKRATIVGGVLRAAEEIHAKALGSVAGSETVLEVGYDPKSRDKLARLEKKIADIDEQLDEVSLNINTLEKLLRMKKELPEDKAQYLKEQKNTKVELEATKERLLEDVQELRDYLESLKINGKISASAKVFAGVRIHIKEAHLEVRNEFKAVTFINEANTVKATKYEELEGDVPRRE